VSTHHIPEGLAPSTSNDKQARINRLGLLQVSADISPLAEVSLWASSTNTQENTAASRGAAMPFFSTRGRRKSRLGVYAAK
jgi:hypothetical protein